MLIDSLIQEKQRYQAVVEHCQKLMKHSILQIELLEKLINNYHSPTEQTVVLVGDDTTRYFTASTVEIEDEIPQKEEAVEIPQLEEQEDNSPKTNLLENESSENTLDNNDGKQSSKTLEELRNVSFPLSDEYMGLTQMDAIKKVMSRNREQAFNVDYIARELYGDLQPEHYRLAVQRLKSALNTGVNNAYWYRVKHQKGFYSLTHDSLIGR